MAKGISQKLKLLYLMEIFLDKTDEEHSLTMPEILSFLESYGIHAERKSIYSDIEALRVYGIDIIGVKKNRNYYYHVGNRNFELAELKLLVDSVQSSKFITAKKSSQLIKKLEKCTSVYEAKQLERQVYVSERIKTMNESIYYNVDCIHYAIINNFKIKFKYFRWNIDKKMELRKNGQFYEVSPWALCWNSDNYYLVGYDSENNLVKHYRVDKMLNINTIEEERDGKELFEKFDTAIYSNKLFGMFGSAEETIKLEFENELVGVVIDRFGKNVVIHKKDKEHFVVNVNVAFSNQFIGWIIALGKGAKILGPKFAVERMKEEVTRLCEQYK
ncbi:MAG: WYL domain-containing protein [Clostridioides sp.]|nr:WYL domain-containing protein [Clostridioides sp.]